ncbi:hypothetical protein [Embleya sp. NPDC059237]|uniref:hypothetical protein n=1 Tax=Embleya sp. NPDC059237 TaxID=3346784 RepID=UPI0036B2AEDC
MEPPSTFARVWQGREVPVAFRRDDPESAVPFPSVHVWRMVVASMPLGWLCSVFAFNLLPPLPR